MLDQPDTIFRTRTFSERPDSTRLFRRLRTETRRLVRVLSVLQIGGVTAVILSTILYCWGRTEHLPKNFWPVLLQIVAPPAAFSVLFLLLVVLGAFERWRRDNNAIDVNETVTRWGTRMMIADATLAACLVASTGGVLSGSPFTPLLMAIPGTAFTLRLPRKSILLIWVSAISAILFFEYLGSSNLPWFEPFAWSSQHGNRTWALVLNTVSSFVLTVVGGYQWLRTRLPLSMFSDVCNAIQGCLEDRNGQLQALASGMRRYLADIGRRSEFSTLSKVHKLDAIIQQCVCLNLIFPGAENDVVRRRVVYFTFVAHWLDDFFDDQLDVGNVIRSPFDVDDPLHNVLKTSPHLRRVNRCMRWTLAISRVHQASDECKRLLWRAWRYLNPGAEDGFSVYLSTRQRAQIVSLGLYRLAISGVFQRCPDGGAARRFMAQHVLAIQQRPGLDPRIGEIYKGMFNDVSTWVLIWGASKCIMDAIEAVHKNFHPDCSELYSILHGPILVYQNLSEERKEETITDAFAKAVIGDEATLPDRLALAVRTFKKETDILLREPAHVRRNRRNQLNALLIFYGERLPERLRKNYQELFDDTKFWAQIHPIIEGS